MGLGFDCRKGKGPFSPKDSYHLQEQSTEIKAAVSKSSFKHMRRICGIFHHSDKDA